MEPLRPNRRNRGGLRRRTVAALPLVFIAAVALAACGDDPISAAPAPDDNQTFTIADDESAETYNSRCEEAWSEVLYDVAPPGPQELDVSVSQDQPTDGSLRLDLEYLGHDGRIDQGATIESMSFAVRDTEADGFDLAAVILDNGVPSFQVLFDEPISADDPGATITVEVTLLTCTDGPVEVGDEVPINALADSTYRFYPDGSYIDADGSTHGLDWAWSAAAVEFDVVDGAIS